MSDLGIIRIEGHGEGSICIIKDCRIVVTGKDGAVNQIFVGGGPGDIFIIERNKFETAGQEDG